MDETKLLRLLKMCDKRDAKDGAITLTTDTVRKLCDIALARYEDGEAEL